MARSAQHQLSTATVSDRAGDAEIDRVSSYTMPPCAADAAAAAAGEAAANGSNGAGSGGRSAAYNPELPV